jgi:hypothetical protein
MLRRPRAWAVWALVREVKPTLQKDHTQTIEEPTIDWIEARLQDEGHTNEVAIWHAALV